MATLFLPNDLHSQIASILATRSLLSYGRALSVIEEIKAELALSSKADSPSTTALLYDCDVYQTLCHNAIHRITARASAHEHELYRRAAYKKASRNMDSAAGSHHRRGVVFNVDKGDHICTALEVLRLEMFLTEQEEQGAPKKVRFIVPL